MISRPRWGIRTGLSYFEANVISEVHSGTATMTEHPTDSGSTVSDHVTQDVDTYACDLAFSDTPMPVEGAILLPLVLRPPTASKMPVNLSGAVGAIVDAVQSPIVAQAYQFPSLPGLARDFVRDAYSYFYILKDDATLCEITTPIRSYYDMVITGISISRPPTLGGAIISLQFQHWRSVQVSTTDLVGAVANALLTKAPRDGVAPDLGVQAKKQPEQVEAGGASILAGALGL
jgi:hypothetical protein